jgi:hypothetical protein
VLDEQRAVNKKKKKDAATFLYGGAAKELEVEPVVQKQPDEELKAEEVAEGTKDDS